MSEMLAFDALGNVVELVIVNTICPIEYAERGRQLSADFLNSSPDCNVLACDMLPVRLRPVGGVDATHVVCSRRCHTHGLQEQIDFFAGVGESWVCADVQTVADAADLILSRFGAVVGDLSSLLAHLNLERV